MIAADFCQRHLPVAAADLRDDDPLAERMRMRVLAMLDAGTPASGLCPSEAAQSLATEVGLDWHHLMRLVRTVAADLARRGRVEVLQNGQIVDIFQARGTVRLVRRTVN